MTFTCSQDEGQGHWYSVGFRLSYITEINFVKYKSNPLVLSMLLVALTLRNRSK